MDKKIRINIQVGESRYPLWVDMDDEPIIREAARMVNRRLITYNTKYRGAATLSPENFLAMAAVDLAATHLRSQGQSTSTEAIEADLAQINNDLEQFLHEEKSSQTDK